MSPGSGKITFVSRKVYGSKYRVNALRSRADPSIPHQKRRDNVVLIVANNGLNTALMLIARLWQPTILNSYEQMTT